MKTLEFIMQHPDGSSYNSDVKEALTNCLIEHRRKAVTTDPVYDVPVWVFIDYLLDEINNPKETKVEKP